MTKKSILDLKPFLDSKAKQYNQPGFIKNDPISIPHRFKKRQDVEIAAFFSSILAWGQRVTIINKTNEFLSLMDDSPYEFLVRHASDDLKPFEKFKHRTFNGTDALYFIQFLSDFYKKHESLEEAFLINDKNDTVEQNLISFHKLFFSLSGFPARTKKHLSTPERKSACKRINMFLRWMVRKDDCGVDFGLWTKISPSQLICPCDLHVERVARKLKLITRKQMNWETALELTTNLRQLDPDDPVKYDFALFGLGVDEKF